MLDRRAMLASLQQSPSRELPPEYQAVEWIQGRQGGGRNTASINLGEQIFINQYSYKFIFGFIPSGSVIPSNNSATIIGGQDTSQNEFNLFFGISKNGEYGYSFGNANAFTVIDFVFEPSKEYIIEVDWDLNTKNLKIIIDDIIVANRTYEYPSSRRWLLIFGNFDAGAVNDKMSFCQYWKDGVLVKDYVACYEKSTNAVGFYDFVSQSLQQSNGGVPFLKGADI